MIKMMSQNGSLREKWMWNREIWKLWVWAFLGMAILFTAALYPLFGPRAYLFLLFSLGSLFTGLIYSFVGRKVRMLKESLSSIDGEMAESLIVIGYIQAPGIAVLTESELHLAQITGRRLTLGLDEIESVRVVTWFNGKKYWWKRGLLVKPRDKERFGFAVSESTARRWSGRLGCIVRIG